MRGSSMTDIGARNERVVLEAIRSAPEGTSQSDVIRHSGLSRQAVSLITRRLLDRGLIETAGTHSEGRGKPRTVLRVVPGALIAAGVHLDPSGILLVLANLSAEVLIENTLGPPTDRPDQDVLRIARGLEDMVEELREAGWTRPGGGDPAEALLGIGVAAPGGIDARGGVILDPPWLPGWRDVPLVEMLEDATDLPAVLDKDTNAALTAENWAGREAEDGTVLYIYVGAGVGSSVASRGRLHHGATTQAGEIGHLPTGLPGAECSCGRIGCLSMFTDIAGMLERAAERQVLPGGAAAAQQTTAEVRPASSPPASTDASTEELLEQLVRAAEDGDEQALELVQQHGAALGEALRTLIGIHDPHVVLLGGPYWRLLEPLALPVARERALRTVRSDQEVDIRSSSFGDDVAAVGAATLYLDRELSPTGR